MQLKYAIEIHNDVLYLGADKHTHIGLPPSDAERGPRIAVPGGHAELSCTHLKQWLPGVQNLELSMQTIS